MPKIIDTIGICSKPINDYSFQKQKQKAKARNRNIVLMT